MKRIILSIIILTTSLLAANGQMVYKNNCKICHMKKMGWKLTDEDKIVMKAPTIYGVTKHIKMIFSNEKQFIEYVTTYITKPQRIQSRCKDSVVNRFGLMPAIGLTMTDDDKKSVAKWMFNKL